MNTTQNNNSTPCSNPTRGNRDAGRRHPGGNKQKQVDRGLSARLSVLAHKIVGRVIGTGAPILALNTIIADLSSATTENEVVARMISLNQLLQTLRLLAPSTPTSTPETDGGANILTGHHDWIAGKVAAWLLADGRPVTSLVDIGGGRGDMARALGASLQLGRDACVCVEQAAETAVWDSVYDFTVNREQVTFVPWNWVSIGGAVPDIPVPDASADVVLIMVALHHMTPDAANAVVCNARRILRPGGRLLIKEHDIRTNDDRIAVDWEHHLYHLMDAYPEPLTEPGVRAYLSTEYVGNFRTKSEWDQLIGGAGFALHANMTRVFDPETGRPDRGNATCMYWQVWTVV